MWASVQSKWSPAVLRVSDGGRAWVVSATREGALGVPQIAGSPYRGPDRRRRNAEACGPPGSARVLVYSGVLCACAGFPALFFIPRSPSTEVLETYAMAAAAFFALLAGVSSLVSWRVIGRAVHAWYGTGLVGLGLLTLAHVGLVASTGGAPPPQTFDVVVVSLVAGGLFWRSIVEREVNAGFAFLPVLMTWVGSGLLAIAALHLPQLSSILPSAGTFLAEVLPAAAAGGVWLFIATATLRREQARGRSVDWRGLVSALLGVGAVLTSLRPVAPAVFPLAAAVLAFLATSLAFGVELTRLDVALRNGEGHQRALFRTLRATQQQTRLQGEQLEEWLHDLRNAVAGLRSVDAVLRAGYDRDLAARMAMADAVSAELARLESLVDPARVVRPAEVDLSEVVTLAVTSERAAGATIEIYHVGIRVWADADALGRALQNVLVNARRYAPGSIVTVRADACGDHVELRVRDRGPGVAPAEREAIFGRGERGGASGGTGGEGLGLYVARRLLRAMAGDITVDAQVSSGCCILISLPMVRADRSAQSFTPRSGWAVLPDPLQPVG